VVPDTLKQHIAFIFQGSQEEEEEEKEVGEKNPFPSDVASYPRRMESSDSKFMNN
jgi:hypothetical protein